MTKKKSSISMFVLVKKDATHARVTVADLWSTTESKSESSHGATAAPSNGQLSTLASQNSSASSSKTHKRKKVAIN